MVPLTPSASPAPASNSRFFPAPYRIPDEAPPQKRQRRSSTPRHPSSSATPDDFNVEREASAMRMWDIWSQLADKYSRRIDEDDIVDLTTFEIVKDRGVLSAEAPWKFGRFADQEESVATDDDEEDGEDEDEDDVDELDSFAGPAAEAVSAPGAGWTVPPVREMDPADARDLEGFMEAETRRREECGEDDTSEDGVLDENRADSLDMGGHDTDVSDAVETPALASRPYHSAGDDESDDELGTWDVVDASNMVVRVAEKQPDNPDIIEILDPPSVCTPLFLAAIRDSVIPHEVQYRNSYQSNICQA